jgi:hypothetical protein
MRLDPVAQPADPRLLAGEMFDSGGRLVVIGEIIDFDALDPADTARFFALLRELTSCGIAVEWRLRTGHGNPRWRDLWHLFPPAEVEIRAGTAGQVWEFWRRQFYYGLCVMRRGPGMVEIRDRRPGTLRCVRFTSPPHLEAIERLETGAPASSIAPDVLADFEAARVVMAIGSTRLWLPCRSRRSPLSPAFFW